ncbi:MAG: ATP-binding protein [Bacillota bacterium]
MPKIQLPAVMGNLDQMIQFVLDGFQEYDYEDKEQFTGKLRLACEEALVNIINYAYGDNMGEVEIIYNFYPDNSEFEVKIIDKGIPFNPLESDTPDIDLPMEEREIGGLGIFMIKEIMDEVRYKREDGKNNLILIKYLN